MHDDLLRPLTRALRSLGVADVPRTAELINAILNSASRMVESGAPLDEVWTSVEHLVAPFAERLSERAAPRT
jgi:hypothetical protein